MSTSPGLVRRHAIRPDMNVTPLVDVVLVLLIIFMVVAPRMEQDVQVDLKVVLGRSHMPLHMLLRMGRGAVIELEATETDMVEILANDHPIARGQIVVTVGREGGDAVVSVADQGIGVPAEEQAKLFQRFFRARNAATRHFGGLGIGLFVSHEIVQRHGGRFLVASESGKGAVFSFTLPLSPAHAAPDRGRAPAQA